MRICRQYRSSCCRDFLDFLRGQSPHSRLRGGNGFTAAPRTGSLSPLESTTDSNLRPSPSNDDTLIFIIVRMFGVCNARSTNALVPHSSVPPATAQPLRI